MTIQSDTGTYAGLDEALGGADLRAVVAVEIPIEELASLSNDLMEFFAAFGESSDNPEETGDA